MRYTTKEVVIIVVVILALTGVINGKLLIEDIALIPSLNNETISMIIIVLALVALSIALYHWRDEISETLGNLIFHTDATKKKISKDERIEFTAQYNSTNNGIAKVYVQGDIKIYFSTSSVATGVLPKDYGMTLCTSEEIVKDKFKVKRLTPSLDWEVYEIEGHAGKNKCCERKLLAYILHEYDKGGSLEDLKVIIYTELEPCIYCYNAMKELKIERNLDLTLYFKDMINEINSDVNTYNDNFKAQIEEIEDIELEFEKSLRKIKESGIVK